MDAPPARRHRRRRDGNNGCGGYGSRVRGVGLRRPCVGESGQRHGDHERDRGPIRRVLLTAVVARGARRCRVRRRRDTRRSSQDALGAGRQRHARASGCRGRDRHAGARW